MAQRLITQLQNYGCELAPEQFKQVLTETKNDLYPNLTEERLACADEESISFCTAVCKRIGVTLPRPFIRLQLLNSHK